jgi:cyclopropane fatty-acyl-phospholipid synthase-like methyltransferase
MASECAWIRETLMPSSFVDSFAPIVKLLVDIKPDRVMDVGPGWGKYGLVCREYLDVAAVHAIEVRAGRNRIQDAIYDWVYTGDVRDYRAIQFWRRWDLVLMIDVIEHMPMDDGHRLINRITSAGAAVLVATPKQWIEQHDDRNPHEEHVSFWTGDDFSTHGILADVSTIDAIIYLLRGGP